jgi:hypothetical protein
MDKKIAYWSGAKNYSSVRYAYVWCEQAVDWDPETNTDMAALYRDYAAKAHHLGHVAKKFELDPNIIQPVNFDTWHEIFCRVYDREADFIMGLPPNS